MWIRLNEELINLAHIRSVSVAGNCLHLAPAEMDGYGARIVFCRDAETAQLALTEIQSTMCNGAAVCDLSWALAPKLEAYTLEV